VAIFYRSKRPYLVKNKLISKYGALAYGIIFFSTLLFVLTKISFNLSNKSLILAIFLLFVPILLWVRYLMSKEKRNLFSYGSGLSGELNTEDELAKLSDEYLVFCDIKIPPNKWNVDFIVVGPTGLLALEVKNHKGKVSNKGKDLLLNGKIPKNNFLKQVKGEARSISKHLEGKLDSKFYVKPILIFSNPGATMDFGLKPVDNVYVINKFYLERLVKSFKLVNWNFNKKKVVEELELLKK